MKQKLKSLRLRILLPVIIMTLFVITMMTTMFSRGSINLSLKEENEANAVAFEAISDSISQYINSSVSDVRTIMADDRVASYAKLRYASAAERVHARLACRDYLLSEITSQDGIYGLLFMRRDRSLFGMLPLASYFWDAPEENTLPEAMITQVLGVELGETVWIGPFSGAEIYGFEDGNIPQSIIIAAWKTVDARYGECYVMMLMDESIFEKQLSLLQSKKSSWHLFTAEQAEFFHTGEETCSDPAWLLQESNSGTIVRDENDNPVCIFSRTMTSPDWTLVQEVSMEDYLHVIRQIQWNICILGGGLLLIALMIYMPWLKRFMRQFNSLLDGIIQMGQGDLEQISFVPTSISEFERMQEEISRTSHALKQQMDTIRQMERERMEQEKLQKEQELVLRELCTAREIQESVLPHIFPPYPKRREFDLYASMDPARDVGGDFYDYYLIDEDHLCLVIADVSGKGIPAAMFMMVAKRILEDSARMELDVSEILDKTNTALCDNNTAEMFVTVWIGILEISTGRLTAANAGHEYPVIKKKNSGFEVYKDRHGFVLGGMEDLQYRKYDLWLTPGDKLFVYTDGLPEAMNCSDEMFGVKRMVTVLNTYADSTPEEIIKGVRSAVDAFTGNAEQFDDLTMLCLEYRGPQV